MRRLDQLDKTPAIGSTWRILKMRLWSFLLICLYGYANKATQ